MTCHIASQISVSWFECLDICTVKQDKKILCKKCSQLSEQNEKKTKKIFMQQKCQPYPLSVCLFVHWYSVWYKKKISIPFM